MSFQFRIFNPEQDVHTFLNLYNSVFISAVGVAASHRRRGLGRALCRKAAEFARAKGRRCVAVSANPMLSFCAQVMNWLDYEMTVV